MADEAKQLAESEDVPLYRAEKALQLEDGDYEEARKRLRNAPVAIKARFASQDNDIYGLFLLEVAVSPPSLKSMNALVGNHRGIGNVKLSLSMDEFHEAIDRLVHEKGKMTALTDQLVEGLQKEFSPPSNEWVELIESREELTLQEAMDELISEYIDEENLITTVSLETGLVEGARGESGDEDTASEETASTDSPRDEVVELLCDVRVSPVRGKPVKNVKRGEQIFVTVKDKSHSEHRQLVDIIERLEDDELGMIPAPVKNISRTKTGKLEFIVQFGENVLGKVVAGEDMNIMTPETVSTSTEGGLLDSILTWLLLFVVIMVIGLSLLYAWLYV